MADNRDPLKYRRSLVIEPKTTTQFNQFLPSKDKASGYVPAPLRKKRAERHDDSRRSWTGPMYAEEDGTFSSQPRPGSSDLDDNGPASQRPPPTAAAHLQWAYEYDSGSDSDAGRPDPDLVLDDLASRRFHSPSPAPPTNFAVPISPPEGGAGPVSAGRGGGRGGGGGTWPRVSVSPNGATTCLSGVGEPASPQRRPPGADRVRPASADSLLRQLWDDSEDEEDEEGYADPVHDDLYARKVGRLSPQPAAASYDRFLPKFWTPEEDAHIRNIKLGSQRRPWYKKMQGFRKKSGSSSDDSDCDVSPWLSSAPPTAGPSPSHPHAPEGSTHPGSPGVQSPYTQLHTAPQQPPKLPTFLLVRPPEGFPRVDPCSGPRLVRGERRALLGREDPLETPEPWEEGDGVDPDLENDDMFARRTQAFHSNIDLALFKSPASVTLSRSTSEPTVSIVTRPRPQGARGRPRLPDIERDDLMYRKVNPQQCPGQRPLSGAPDHYKPMPVPEPWALPPALQARLMCPPCPLTREAQSEKRDEKEGQPTDDMLLRKFGVAAGLRAHPDPSANQRAPSVPASCSEGDLQKMQKIREASRLRFKKRMLLERLAFLNS